MTIISKYAARLRHMTSKASRLAAGVVAAGAVFVGLASADPALALPNKGMEFQGNTALERPIIDKNGIDLMSGRFSRRDTLMSIGDPKAGGLEWVYSLHTTDQIIEDRYSGKVVLENATYGNSAKTKVTVGGEADSFSNTTSKLGGACSTTCVNTLGRSSTLVLTTVASVNTYVYTDSKGDTYNFDPLSGTVAPPYTGTIARLSSINYANGVTITISYDDSSSCTAKSVGCPYRIKSVVSNMGYAFKYEYGTAFYQLSKVSAINLANTYCDTSTMACASFDSFITVTWPVIAGKNIVRIVDPAGKTWEYGSNDNNTTDIDVLDHVKMPAGEAIDVTYDIYGRATSYVSNIGTWGYHYSDDTQDLIDSADGRDTRVTNPDGSQATYSFTKEVMLPTGVHDELNRFTAYNLTAVGNGFAINKVTKPEGDYITFTYDPRGNITSTTSTPKAGSGLSATVTYANFDTTCTNQKTCNKPNWTEDARGNYTYYTYDATHGGVTSVTSPADSAGVTPKTVTTYATYTAQVKTSAGGMANAGTVWLPQTVSTCATAVTCDGTVNQFKTTTAYATYNLLPSSITMGAGDGSMVATTASTYDAIGNVVKVDGPRSDVDDTSFRTYDANRRLVYELGVDPDGSGALKRKIVYHVYDDDGVEIRTDLGSGSSTTGSDFVRAAYLSNHFNSAGQKDYMASYIDGNANPQTLTQFSYDNRGRLLCTAVRMNPTVYGTVTATNACTLGTTSTTYGPDRITYTIYDVASQVTDTVRAYGVTTANGFPATLQQTYAHYVYTNNGLKQSETDADGDKTLYVYDGFDRLYQVQYPSTSLGSGNPNASDYEQYGYDNNGNKTSWRRRDGATIGFSYDNLNREIVKDIPGGTTADVYAGYDLMGHIKYRRFGSATGAGTSYNYDGLGRMSSTTDINSRTVWFGYNEASSRNIVRFPDMNATGYAYDAAERMISIGLNSANGLFTQNYDDLGRMTGQVKAGGSTGYGYDNLGRLMSMSNDLNGTAYDVTWNFAYTPGGQLDTFSGSSTVYDYQETGNSSDAPSYDGLNRDSRLVPVSTPCPSGGYDTRQNLICDGKDSRNFTYDIENRLLTAGGAGSGGAITLSYDPEGRLSSYTTGSARTEFLYDGTMLIAEYNHPLANAVTDHSGDVLLRRYMHGTGADTPLVWIEGSGTAVTAMRWFYTDYHGSVIGFSDNAGTLSQLYKYGPYGEPKDSGNNDAWGTGVSRFRYTGQTALVEAHLYYYKARVYDPKWGRFLQTDPIGSKDDLDLYSYVGDDPINKVDPTGTIINIPNHDQQDTVVALINAISKQQYKVDTKGNLVKDDKAKENKNGSSFYSKQINKAISGKETTSIIISPYIDTVVKSHGVTRIEREDLSEVGGGQTINSGRTVYITGQSSYDTGINGQRVESSPAQILAHEIAGHAVPNLYGRITGNAIKDENIIRSQTHAPLLAPQPWHVEY